MRHLVLVVLQIYDTVAGHLIMQYANLKQISVVHCAHTTVAAIHGWHSGKK